MSLVMQIFGDESDSARWIVSIHHVVIHNLVDTAIQADEAHAQRGHAGSDKLSAAATHLQSSVFPDTLRRGELHGMQSFSMPVWWHILRSESP